MDVKPGYKQTEMGVIPEDWIYTTVREIAVKVGSGVTPTGGSKRYKAFGRPFVRSQNVGWGRLLLDDSAFIDEETHNGFPATELKRDDVLLNITGASIGRTALADERVVGGNVNQHVCIIRLDETRAVPKLISLMLLSALGQNQIDSFQAGGNRQGLNFAQIASIKLPLPSTTVEQQAIAEALSDVNDLVESLEQLIAKKRYLKQGTMQELLTGKKRLPGFEVKPGYKHSEVGVIPEDWCLISAYDACSKIQDGTHFSPRVGGSGYLYITSKNIRFGYLDISTAGRIDSAQHHAIYKRCDVQKGDLLLTKDGANTGNAALNALDEEFSLLSSVAFLRFHDSKYCPAYFLQQILTSRGQRQIKDAMAGNAITRLTLEKIKKLSFPAPPTKSEQVAIASILSEMDAEIVALEGKLAKARQLNQGMMQELLAGRTRLI